MNKVRHVKVKTFSTDMGEVTQVDLEWINLALKQLCPDLNQKQISKRAILARALTCYVSHLEDLTSAYNNTETGDFDGRADIRFESMSIKQTGNPLATATVSLETLDRHGIVADGKLHSLRGIKAALPSGEPKARLPAIPRWMMTAEENKAISNAQAERKAKRKAKQAEQDKQRGDT